MAGLDWIIIGVIALSVLLAAAQGFFFEMFSLGGAVLGYVLAAWQYGRLAPWFEPYVKSTAVANAAAFFVIFTGVMVLAGAAGKIVRWMMKEVGLRWVDRILGGAFGLLRGVVMVTVGVLALATFVPESKALERSELSRYFLVTGKAVSWLAPGELRQKFQEGIALLRKNRMEALAPAQPADVRKDQQSAAGGETRR
ncbi:MAG TPA: CvpA family protein [Terriglobales bacterium]|nr:CvpA family protein [Terriglobales bacterium]